MTIEQYMSDIGMQFWRSTSVSLIVTLAELTVLLFFVWGYSKDNFFQKRSLLLHALLLILYLVLNFKHYTVIVHCMLTLLLCACYICMLTKCSWFNGIFESSIFILLLELGKSLCRDGLLAFGFTKLFTGMSSFGLNLTMLSLYLCFMALLCVLFFRRRSRWLDFPITPLQAAGLIFPLILYLVVRTFQYDLIDQLDNIGWLYMDILQYAVAVCALLVMSTTGSLLSSQLERNELLRRRMLDRQYQQQYQVRQESIEFVNRRYHDLKHYLTGIETILSDADSGTGSGIEQARELVENVRREIDPYGSMQRTGSSVMDVLLSHRIQECRDKNIRLLPYIDGSPTGFLSTLDLCALFGNAMDNAIEAANTVSDDTLREIHVKIGSSDGLLLMRFFNHFEGDRKLSGTHFLTTKDNTSEHGFGLRNIAAIAEKYGGTISTECSGNSFTLHILIPLPENK